MRLCLVASKPTDSVIFGFLPAAAVEMSVAALRAAGNWEITEPGR